jgi:hypothetical protein
MITEGLKGEEATMLIWLACLLLGHKTVSKVAIGEKYDYINPITGLPDKGQDFTFVRLGFCARCGHKVHDGKAYPMVSKQDLAEHQSTER